MNWSNKYIGIPFVVGGRDFTGCDCGGLVLLVLREEKGIVARDFTEYETADFDNMRGYNKLAEGISNLVSEEWKVIDAPKPFDLMRFKVGKSASHVGIYVGRNMFLHVEDYGGVARLTSMHDMVWGPRLFEICRHKKMME